MIAFNKYYNHFNIVSSLLIIVSLVLLIFKGLNFGIDFKGGTLIELRSSDTKINVSSLRDNLKQMDLGDVSVKKFGNDQDYLIKFENKGVAYSIPNKDSYKDKTVAIFGGGDSALDWTVELSKIAKHIYLVHRREEFRAVEHTVSQMRELVEKEKVSLYTKNQLFDADGDERIKNVSIKNQEGEIKTLDCDEILVFHGLKNELGPINDWGLGLSEKQIVVNTEDFQTNLEGIFAIGDIATYPGKLKLILSGFHEAALAAQKAFKRAKPDENLLFRYSTSDKDIHERLGLKK